MSWMDEYYRRLQEAYARLDAAFSTYVFDDPWFYGTPVEPVSNTFLANPVPREGFIDARRDDGCVPVITDLVLS